MQVLFCALLSVALFYLHLFGLLMGDGTGG